MAKIILMKNTKKNEKEIINAIKEGKIFIYPTDTIYGLGCNALDENAVNRLREIKQRDDKPFSVIAPSVEWINKNFTFKNKAQIRKLPGPFTFIVKIKKSVVADNVSKETLAIRIPDHKFTKVIQKAKLPFITTSVNISGKKPIRNIKDVPNEILDKVDYMIDDGVLDINPSVIIDLTGDIPKIVKRD